MSHGKDDHGKGQDPEVCVCFHVPLGKLAKFCRLEKPKAASQLASCYGAGTGCGWCIPFLEKIHEQVKKGEEPDLGMSREEYLNRRGEYHRASGRKVPAAEAEGGSSKEKD